MPIRIVKTATSGQGYLSPFIGPDPVDNTVAIPVTLSGMSAAEVDAQGVLKPGVPLTRAGTLVGVGGVVFGVVTEQRKVATSNAAGDLTSAGTQDIAVSTIGQVSRAIIEDNLGRVLTADEIAGFSAAGSLLKLIA